MAATFSLTKGERLTSKSQIEKLFAAPEGSVFAHPVKLTWVLLPATGATGAQVLFSVPKKNFKRAHDRNRIKRQLREVYRKNKSILYDFLTSNQQQACFLLGYVAKEHTQTHVLEKKITSIFIKFTHAAAQQNT